MTRRSRYGIGRRRAMEDAATTCRSKPHAFGALNQQATGAEPTRVLNKLRYGRILSAVQRSHMPGWGLSKQRGRLRTLFTVVHTAQRLGCVEVAEYN